MPTDSSSRILPLLGFYYSVQLVGSNSADDSRFKEVTGLSVEIPLEEVAEGGENRFRHKVPGVPKYTNLVLKRGMIAAQLPFYQWCNATLLNNFSKPIQPKTISIALLNTDTSQPMRTWTVNNAWPVKWSISDFNSMDGQVVIETLEMAYENFSIS
jgi:phage tail-like protein